MILPKSDEVTLSNGFTSATVTLNDTVAPLYLAVSATDTVMVAVPAASAVILPLASILTTLGSEEL